jgi:DNA-binding GntR family transcriptional regulator
VKSEQRIHYKVTKEICPARLSRRPGSQQIYTRLKQMIISGELKKGRILSQEKIARGFGVSQPTVAIAFSRLKKDGLVICEDGVGSFIV